MTLTALALTATTVALADDPRPDPPPVRVWVSSAYQPPYDRSNRERPRVGKPQASDSGRPRAAVAKPLPRDRQNVAALALAVPQARPLDRCRGAQQAIGRYRKAYTRSRAVMGLPGAVPRAWYPCPAARRRALEWRNKAELARRHADSWVQWNYSWQTWMPRGSKWYRVASCETGYGRDPNWSHDSGTYVSAFGIYRPGYADDAHRIGNLSWDETVRVHGRVPTPREQYDAALSHYRAHGGFSGWGCRGA